MSLESSFRKQDLHHASLHASSSGHSHFRRATVGSPTSFSYTNTFELDRPHSRNDKLHDHRYPYPRRSTISHSQGHNVNDSMKLTPNADTTKMWSESASPSPVMSNSICLPVPSPTLSATSSRSPKLSEPNFEYEHMAFSNTLPTSMAPFTLCPSPSFNGPRSMVPSSDSLLPHPNPWHEMSHASNTDAREINTPALSPAATSSSAFIIEGRFVPSTDSSPRSFIENNQDNGSSSEDSEEVKQLRQRVQELEHILAYGRSEEEIEPDNKAHVQHVQHAFGLGLQTDSTNGNDHINPVDPVYHLAPFSFLNQNLGPPPPDWQKRTAARLKRLCALNRAGNALCSWHDPRRERRAYPPRMAPAQTLNCGCTFAEALFEESLARNGVGAFYPGGSVRMDPALRNPLLKLLEQRYGYRDGDFERTPDGGWREGEDAHSWEQKVANAGRSRRER